MRRRHRLSALALAALVLVLAGTVPAAAITEAQRLVLSHRAGAGTACGGQLVFNAACNSALMVLM